MGWDGYHDRRKWVADQKLKTWPYRGNTMSIRKHHAHRDEDWFILDEKAPDGTLVESSIAVTIWEGGMKKAHERINGPVLLRMPD